MSKSLDNQRARGPGAGIVFSGGGIRGAYEVGVVQGIIDELGLEESDAPPFRIFSGTSVGAINATFLASNTHRGDLAVADLATVWKSLRVQRHVRIDPLGILGWRRPEPSRRSVPSAPGCPPVRRRSLLDSRPLERLIADAVDWGTLHDNVAAARTAALFVTALRVTTGRTTIFAELAPDLPFTGSRDPRRIVRQEQITHAHVLASAALPLIFPARCVGARFYCDGGLRFNTPISPAIRAGAERLVIVSLLHERKQPEFSEQQVPERYPSPLFLLGKLLNALLLDPIVHDLNVLERFNRLVDVLESELDPAELQRVNDVLERTRGTPYRKLETLVLRPSRDIGEMAAQHIREHLPRWDVRGLSNWVLKRVARAESQWESDLASYVLFDGSFASRLIELGISDAREKRDEIKAFFGTEKP